MIQEFVTLIDKLIQLLKARKDAEERPLDVLVTPMYLDLQVIHNDYLHMFEKCRRDIESGVALGDIANALLSDRLEMEAVRHSVSAFVDSYSENPRLKRYHEFFRSVWMYFYRYDMMRNVPGTLSQILLGELDKWVREGQKQAFAPGLEISELDARKILAEVVSSHLCEIRRRWEELSKQYANLMAAKV